MSVLQPGRNCWRIERAQRVGFLIDAAAYFDCLASAMQRAEQSILLIGWDFHSEALLRPTGPGAPPLTLARHLKQLTSQNPRLAVHVLCWDFSPLYLPERELWPLLQFRWKAPRVRFKYAADHPVGASHHQKFAVIDDKLAFVGGLDLTINRWDEPAHRLEDPRRLLPDGELYAPFHDVQLAADGDLARALGELARLRWQGATGQALSPVTSKGDPWPPDLSADLRDVDVALTRTLPERPPYTKAREVECLHLDAIAAARQSIYVENQFITSPRIVEALRSRLAESDGPEILLVTPRELAGRLEQVTMGFVRAKLITRLREADRHGRLRVVCPVQGSVGINVHAKLMVVDDRFVRIGSANLSTRSMRLDTECDAAIEVPEEDGERRRAIARFRDSLLAEHLGVEREAIADLVARMGLLRAVEQASNGERRLEDLDVEETPPPPADLPDALIDPSRALDEALVEQALPQEAARAGRRAWGRLLALALPLALLVVWMATPLRDSQAAQTAAEIAASVRAHPAGLLLSTVALAAATLLMVPVTAALVVMVLLFDAFVGCGATLAGSLLGASAGYGLGRVSSPQLAQRVAGRRLDRLTRKLSQRGLLAVLAVRLVPVAPFSVVNLVAGRARIAFRDFMLGSVLGMTPGMVALALATDRVLHAAKRPDVASVGIALVLVAAIVLGLRWLQKRLERITA